MDVSRCFHLLYGVGKIHMNPVEHLPPMPHMETGSQENVEAFLSEAERFQALQLATLA